MSNNKRIIFIRHPKTFSNKKDIWCNCNDNNEILSTEYGNIEEIVKKIASLNPDIIYSSPMQRCLYLAKRFSSITHGTVVIENRLLERDFGQLEGKPVVINDKQIIGDFDLNSDLNQGVEKIQDMYFKRIKPFLDEVCKSKNKQILIVSHSWVGRLFRYYFTNDKSIIQLTPKNLEIISFEIKN